ncbi:MAG: response regulator transcription factor [Acidimicrobiia bacterium]
MTRTVHVLIVDDQEAFRAAARMVVDLSDGFEVVGEADSGEEGIRLVGSLNPDLVLMDVKMGGIDGLEATRRIVAENAATRVVVLSTYDEYVQQALEAGAVAFISKSDFSPDALNVAWTEAP